MLKKFALGVISATIAFGATTAQAFPNGPITLIVPFGAGTSVDLHGRDFAQYLSAATGQSVVVDNRPGAEGTIGALATLNARPDGNTLMFTSSSIVVLDPLMKKNMRFDPVKDFKPICMLGRTSNVMHITGSSPIETAQDLIKTAKENPGKVTFAYSSATTRLAALLFQQSAGLEMLGVPYKTSAMGLTDTASGQVDLFFIDHLSASGYYPEKRLRPLAVSGSERVRDLPDVPTANEIGVPGWNIQPWFGVYAAANVPEDILAKVREYSAKAINSPEARANAERRGLLKADACGDDMAKVAKEEMEALRAVLAKAGIEPQ